MTERDRIAHLAKTCAGINLRRAARALTNQHDHIFLKACGLRATQISPLAALYLAGPQTIHQIAERLELDRTTLSRNLKPLEETGLVTISSGDDQRTRRVVLTPEGEKKLFQVLPIWEEAQQQVISGLGGERFESLLIQLSKIAEQSREG